MYEKILVPLDGSELAKRIIPHVVQFARTFGSEVIVVNVCEPEETEAGQVCRLYVQNEVGEVQKAVSGSGARARGEVLAGYADEQVLSYARGARANLIFMSSHGRSGAKHGVLGSTVNKILHKTGVPLVVTRVVDGGVEAGELFRKILVPLDGSETAEKVLPHVNQIAAKAASEVLVVRVIEAGKQVHSIGGLNFVPYKDEDMGRLRKTASDYLETVKPRLSGARNVTAQVRQGDSAKEIMQAAAGNYCSIIALSSHGHSRVEAWAFGSVTYKILQAGNTSVLFVPAFAT